MGRLTGANWRDGYDDSYLEYEEGNYTEPSFSPEDIPGVIAEVKVRGGKSAFPGQFPHQVSLQTRWKRHVCGASVIHPLILLTAAHCFDTLKVLRGLRAVTGEQNLAVTEKTEQIRNISRLIMHENWNGTTWDNDIALLVLDRPLEFNKYTQPIRIPKANTTLPPTADVSGWGLVSRKRRPDVLQKATIAIRTHAKCNRSFKSSGSVLTENMICAGGTRDACEGDSGGPLTCRSFSGEPFLCGLVSWGMQYCENKSPGVYTDMSKYHDWITSHLREIVKTHRSTQRGNTCGAVPIVQPQVTCITCRVDDGNLGGEPNRPYVALFHLHADVEYRYSRTQVTSVVVNPNGTNSEEVTFRLYLPDTAFISNFSMNVNGTAYNAYAEDRKTARRKYNSSRGSSAAGIVESSFLQENLFNVNVSAPPGTDVTFTLIYEQLLPRRAGLYEQAIHIDLENFKEATSYEITATISDSRNITVLRALGTDNSFTIDDEIKGANVLRDGNVGTVSWSPETSDEPHIPQSFVLQYDVEPEVDSPTGQIIIRDGYFAHFFSPSRILPFEKHLIFVLEVSSLINETVLSQLKEGVVQTLGELDRKDRFTVITFNDNVTVEFENAGYGFVKRAKSFTMLLKGNGGANLHGALMTALNLASSVRSKEQPFEASSTSVKPIIVLFSTGNVTSTGGISNHTVIQSEISAANADQKVPIFSLAYDPSSDFEFLRKISAQNYGFARKFSPESDQSLDLEQFYTEISSPLLDDLNFTYNPSNTTFNISDVTATSFPSYFKGSNLIVIGKLEQSTSGTSSNSSEWLSCDEKQSGNTSLGIEKLQNMFNATFSGRSKEGWRQFTSSHTIDCNCLLKTTSSFMERLWAYMKIKQVLLEADRMTEDQLHEIRERGCEHPETYAQRLALKYGFVTPVTSLVVVQPSAQNLVVELPGSKVLVVKGGTRTASGNTQQSKLTAYDRCGWMSPKQSGSTCNSSSAINAFTNSSVPKGTLLRSSNVTTILPNNQTVLSVLP